MQLYADILKSYQDQIDDAIDAWADAHNGKWPSPELCEFNDLKGCKDCILKLECGRVAND